jgi:ribosomal protein S18 acetylase RimI-like enzyme
MVSGTAASEAVEIRRARKADLPTIIALDERVTRVPKTEYWRDLFERFSEQEQGRAIFIAEINGRVVGFAIGEVRAWEFGSPPCGWIFGFDVDPEFRERGIGSRLLNALTSFFRSCGVSTLRTMLRRDDNLIMSFFRSQGLMAGPFIQLEKDISE